VTFRNLSNDSSQSLASSAQCPLIVNGQNGQGQPLNIKFLQMEPICVRPEQSTEVHRSIAELLQNAVDEKATRIVVLLQDDGSLIVEHTGSPFSAANSESLCMRGVSSKGAGTVGFMAIGFKSVFRSFECAEVTSGGTLHEPR
jgi:hypothetical protein